MVGQCLSITRSMAESSVTESKTILSLGGVEEGGIDLVCPGTKCKNNTKSTIKADLDGNS